MLVCLAVVTFLTLCVAFIGGLALGQVAFALALEPLDAFEYAPVRAPRRSLVEIQDSTVQR